MKIVISNFQQVIERHKEINQVYKTDITRLRKLSTSCKFFFRACVIASIASAIIASTSLLWPVLLIGCDLTLLMLIQRRIKKIDKDLGYINLFKFCADIFYANQELMQNVNFSNLKTFCKKIKEILKDYGLNAPLHRMINLNALQKAIKQAPPSDDTMVLNPVFTLFNLRNHVKEKLVKEGRSELTEEEKNEVIQQTAKIEEWKAKFEGK